MSLLERLVLAVEKRPSLWYPSGTPDPAETWEGVAEEVFANPNEDLDWLSDADTEEKALYCQDEWIYLRRQYVLYMKHMDKNIYTRKKYKDGHAFKPLVLEFLTVTSNRVERLEAVKDRRLRRSSDYGYKYEDPEPWSKADLEIIEDFHAGELMAKYRKAREEARNARVLPPPREQIPEPTLNFAGYPDFLVKMVDDLVGPSQPGAQAGAVRKCKARRRLFPY
ncbi:uncharacterized protein LOC123317068 [Coccinella septempunctata]|uniref:uncharacterized protein LOC123317068 n=1 Tax=Coccinella septempunctata TaxID=41139 RepID=UPI001D086C35|nr:uncharacterized protein LOC123317068 [Coccinella septempunctata]